MNFLNINKITFVRFSISVNTSMGNVQKNQRKISKKDMEKYGKN